MKDSNSNLCDIRDFIDDIDKFFERRELNRVVLNKGIGQSTDIGLSTNKESGND